MLDLACGRGGYGLLIAQKAGTSLIGVDFAAQALTEARSRLREWACATRASASASSRRPDCPDASAEAVLCTDAIQFPDEPALAYAEIRRVLKPGGRVVLTCWEPLDRNDERLPLRVRRADLGAGLHQAAFTGVEVRDRPSWLAREHALWEQTATLARRRRPRTTWSSAWRGDRFAVLSPSFAAPGVLDGGSSARRANAASSPR